MNMGMSLINMGVLVSMWFTDSSSMLMQMVTISMVVFVCVFYRFMKVKVCMPFTVYQPYTSY